MKKIFLALALLTAVGIASYCRSETPNEIAPATDSIFAITIGNGLQKPTSFFVTVECTHADGSRSTKTLYTCELLPRQESTLSLKKESIENPIISAMAITVGYEKFSTDMKDMPKMDSLYFI